MVMAEETNRGGSKVDTNSQPEELTTGGVDSENDSHRTRFIATVW